MKVKCHFVLLLKPSRNCRYLGLGAHKTTSFLDNVMAKTSIAHKREILCCRVLMYLILKRTWGTRFSLAVGEGKMGTLSLALYLTQRRASITDLC